MRRRAIFLLAAGAFAQESPTVTFGTTVASSSGLRGTVYLLKPHQEELPNFKRLRPAGTIYTTSLQIPPRSFQDGFPGITNRFEWFAIDYTGRFWVDRAGPHRFRLLSDDGSNLYVNDKLLIDNDGIHSPLAVDGSAFLTRGVHTIRISYYQGPRDTIALFLSVMVPGEIVWRIFDSNDFKPPPDPSEWIPGQIRDVKRGSNW